MANVTINDIAVISGSILMPIAGVWTADLMIDQPDGTGFASGTAVTIRADDDFELKGIVSPKRAGDFLDSVHVRVLGGKGGMGKSAQAKSYTQPGAYVRDVANGLASDAGETLSSTIDSALIGTNLLAWAVTNDNPVSASLQVLLDIVALGAEWRILGDGTLWFGVETWPTSTPQYNLMNSDPSDNSFMLGVDSPSIQPGVTIDGVGKINRVEHLIGGHQIRSHVWTQSTQADRGIKGAVQGLVYQALAGIDYFTMYDAKVVSQNGTTVDLQPVDTRLPGMGSVPLRHGVPGLTVTVSPGAIIRLGWDRGNPQYPYAALWNGGETVTALTFTANAVNVGGTGGDNVLTKTDMTNLISAISAMATTGNTGGALTFTAPPSFSSNTVKATR